MLKWYGGLSYRDLNPEDRTTKKSLRIAREFMVAREELMSYDDEYHETKRGEKLVIVGYNVVLLFMILHSLDVKNPR
jgi:hypothetical protein